jgi:hypothetical protein
LDWEVGNALTTGSHPSADTDRRMGAFEAQRSRLMHPRRARCDLKNRCLAVLWVTWEGSPSQKARGVPQHTPSCVPVLDYLTFSELQCCRRRPFGFSGPADPGSCSLQNPSIVLNGIACLLRRALR